MTVDSNPGGVSWDCLVAGTECPVLRVQTFQLGVHREICHLRLGRTGGRVWDPEREMVPVQVTGDHPSRPLREQGGILFPTPTLPPPTPALRPETGRTGQRTESPTDMKRTDLRSEGKSPENSGSCRSGLGEAPG